MVDASSFAPRSWEGSIVRFAPTPSGGAEVMAWRDGAWHPANVPARKLLALPHATTAELEAAGVPARAMRHV